VLIRFCKRTYKAILAERGLAKDVTSAAYLISVEGRPFEEVPGAATHFPLLFADDLAVITSHFEQIASRYQTVKHNSSLLVRPETYE
jgi:hypothetical protein